MQKKLITLMTSWKGNWERLRRVQTFPPVPLQCAKCRYYLF